MTDLHWRTATDLAEALRRREVSAEELLEHHLRRRERLDGPLGAVVAIDEDGARARAREADAALARGELWGPLHGLPMTVKDSLEVVGMPTTSGAPELAAHRPARHADAVQRIVDAGAVVWGKTNLPLYAGDFQTFNDVYGTTGNPWNLERTPGGSSGGSAAALAAGFTPLELGSDIGGSIRNPAHYCGVYGHKPSFGIVPGRGHIPGPPGALSRPDLAVVGPLARSVVDLELALDRLAAPSPEDAAAWRFELPPPRRAALGGFRVAAWLEAPETLPLAGDVADLLARAVDRIAAAGVAVDAAARPEIDVAASYALYLRLLYGAMGPGLPPEVKAGLDAAHASLDPGDATLFAQLARGASGRHRDWLADHERREHLRAAWARFFEGFDVLLCPVMPTAAFPHDHGPIDQRTIAIDGARHPYMDQVFWAGLATVAYLPSTVVPVGRTPDGLPVGMQVVGPWLEDRTPLRFARLLEDVLGGFEPPAGY